jgi:arginine decarboxylase
MHGWTHRDSLELYNLEAWGAGFFTVNDRGHVEVRPHGGGNGGQKIDLLDLVRDLEQRGLRAPLLIRFSDILAARVKGLCQAFTNAIREYGYRGSYRGVYPIKVNQQRHVVEEIVEYGAASRVGLEAGSKPELLVALALLDTPGALIVCNGYKDRAYVETALLAQRIGRTPIIVVDRFHEIDLLIKTSRELGIRPHIGVRARLTARGAGKWVESTGDRSKFGLSAIEIVEAVERLRTEDMLDCLELLHFHIGSQISAIRAHKEALSEASRIFVGLHELGARPTLLDVGGGLGVDYDGSRTNFHSSKNYSTQEYANDVVAVIQEACDGAGVPHPDIVTEAGRAMVAHHSVLVFDVLGVSEVLSGESPPRVTEDDPKVVQNLVEVMDGISKKNLMETYHDALQLKEEAALLLLLREDPQEPPRAAGGARRPRAAREGPRRHLLRQSLRLPIGARPLGGQAALPDPPDPPARGEADPARHLRRPHLRQRRQARPVHRRPRREGRARAARLDGGALLHRHLPGGRLPGDPR